jgi:hypothetical protein
MNNFLTKFLSSASQWEDAVVDLVSRWIPWLAPVPTAYMIGAAAVRNMGLPVPVAVVAAVVIEALGFASVYLAVTFLEYNATRKSGYPQAPLVLALLIVVIYFCAVVMLTIVLDQRPDLMHWAYILFILLSFSGASVRALQNDHRRRLAVIEQAREERRGNRQANRQANRPTERPAWDGESSGNVYNIRTLDGRMDVLAAGRQAKHDRLLDSILDVYRTQPDAGPTAVGRAVGASRSTVYNCLEELKRAGRVRRNGNGFEVV